MYIDHDLWYNKEMKNIFLVDNNIIYSAALESQLRVQKSNVLASDGSHGLEHTFREILLKQPNIVIMDTVFPNFDGLDLLHNLQSSHDTNHIPLAVYTHSNNLHLKESIRSKGATHFFLKDEFDPERLIERLFKIYKLT